MYYIVITNLFYEFIAHSMKPTWKFDKLFISEFFTVCLHGLILLPSMAYLFLSRFPTDTKNIKKVVIYYSLWIINSIAIDYIAYKWGFLTFHNKWNFGWEIFFYITMYPMLRIHYRNYKVGLLLSIVFVIFYLSFFNYKLW